MNYIYDIVLNYFKDYYEFYEWKSSDNIINVKKIPVFKVSNKIYLELLYNKVTIDEKFINLIKNKTLIYNKLKINNYMCIFTTSSQAFGALFNSDGSLYKKSSLILEEESEIINEAMLYEETKIDLNKSIKIEYLQKGRIKTEKRKIIEKFLNNNRTNESALKYIYYDYFEQDENNIKIIYDKIKQELKKDSLTSINKLYSTINLFNKIKG